MPYTVDFIQHELPKALHPSFPGWFDRTAEPKERERHYEVWENGVQTGFRALTQDEIPQTLVLKSTKKSFDISTFDNAWAYAESRALVVRDDFRALVEELDPGLHQFLNINVMTNEGDPIAGDWFLMNVMHRQKTIIPTEDAAYPHPTNPERMGMIVKSRRNLVVDTSKLSPANLWREEGYRLELFVSDQFPKLLKDNGIKFYKFDKTKTA